MFPILQYEKLITESEEGKPGYCNIRSYAFYTPKCPNTQVGQYQSESPEVPKIQDWALLTSNRRLGSFLSTKLLGNPGESRAEAEWDLWDPTF